MTILITAKETQVIQVTKFIKEHSLNALGNRKTVEKFALNHGRCKSSFKHVLKKNISRTR